MEHLCNGDGMKNFRNLAVIIFLLFGISACSKIPKECEDTWDKIEEIAKSSGVPPEALSTQKKQFEEQVQAMEKNQAIESCKAQSSVFDLIK